jgi:hypothetical protein
LNNYTKAYGSDSTVVFGETNFAKMKVKRFYYRFIRRPLYLVLCLVSIVFSLAVFAQEILLFSSYKLTFLKNWTAQYNFLAFYSLGMGPYFYAVLCLYFALFRVKLNGVFGFYGGHNTDSVSMLFYASQIARFSGPMSFNYMQILNMHEAAFSTIMGRVDLVPVFGTTFPTFFPILLCVLCVGNLFNVYNKMLTASGLKSFRFAENFNDEKIDIGRGIILKHMEIIDKEGGGKLFDDNRSKIGMKAAGTGTGGQYAISKKSMSELGEI